MKPTEVEADAIIVKFKAEVEDMRKKAKADDTMPANVFFMFMDILIPAMETLAEVNKELRDGSSKTTDNRA